MEVSMSSATSGNSELQQYWGKKVENAVVGRVIKEVRYLTEEEQDSLGWCSGSIVLFLDNGDYLLASSDDEGNGPGALFTNIKGLEVIPVCS
jgi:hypothetical protein